MNPPLFISEVRLLPARDSRDTLIHFASFLVNHQIFIGNVAVRLRPDGRSIRLTFPTKTLPNGVTLSCVHPISREVNTIMTSAVAEKMQELAQKM